MTIEDPETETVETDKTDASDNVYRLAIPTRLDLPIEQILEAAKTELDEDGVVVLGWDENGDLYFASSIADGGTVMWLLELAKKELLNAMD